VFFGVIFEGVGSNIITPIKEARGSKGKAMWKKQ
jgi:hypothetical protein